MITSQYTFLTNLVSSSNSLRNQLAQAQEQVASGLESDTYSGLGTAARTSLDLNPELQHISTWKANIDSATGRLGVTQDALTSINSIASTFFAQSNALNSNDASSVATLAQDAKAALQQVGNLLNSKSGDVYVFAGTDTANPPLPSTDPTVLSTALLASTTSQAPFSTTLTTAVPEVQVGYNQWVKVGLLANANTLATSSPPTTGSYTRDILTSLANLAGLSGTGASTQSTAAAAAKQLSGAITTLGEEQGALGNIQASLTQQQSDLGAVSTTLTTQLNAAQNADPATAVTKASALQTQLQASYQIIAKSQSLSLASYI